MSYTPPAYTDVGGVVLTGYTPPAYTDVGGDVAEVPSIRPSGIAPGSFGSVVTHVTASFTPTGWDSSALGAPLVYNLLQQTFPSGIASGSALGVLVVFNSDQYIAPTGAAHGAFGTSVVINKTQFVGPVGTGSTYVSGTPGIYNYVQYIFAGGWQSSSTPSATRVFDALQVAYAQGIEAPTFPVTHYVADYYQYIDLQNRGPNTHAVGSHAVDFRVRTLAVPFIYTNAFGTPVVESFLNIPQPWRSSALGTAFVSLRVREIAHWASTPTVQVPYPTIANQNRYLRQRGWGSLQVQLPTVYNLTQYVAVGPFLLNSPVNDLGLPQVANRNRQLWPSGFSRLRFGNRTDTFVTLSARAVVPVGVDSLTWGPDTFIAHRIRYVVPESWDSLRMRHWTVVYNDAFLIEPLSIGESSRFGRPDPVFSNQQTLWHYNSGDQSAFGTAFVAPRVRTVYPLNISFPTDFHPTVRLNPQIVAPAGIDLFRPYGHVVLSVFQRIASPRSFNVHQDPWVGVSTVQNRNRQLRPQPVVRTEYGRAQLYNRNQIVVVPGLPSLHMGSYVVDYRTKRVVVAQIGAPTISLTHRVRKSVADPPGTQQVFTLGIFIGLETRPGVVPTPVMRHPTIYPEGVIVLSFGIATVRTNVISPKSFMLDDYGIPVFSAAQYLFLTGFEETVVPPQRVSPHRIYAPYGDMATTQARYNHPVGAWHPIDGSLSPRPGFGTPAVSTSPRNVHTEGDAGAVYGTPSVANRKRFVYPVSFRGLRIGPVIILNVPQYVVFDEDNPGFTSSAFGTPDFGRPVQNPWPVTPPSGEFTAFGTTEVQLLNREILTTGIPHRGNPQQNLTNPWGTAVVGYPRTYTLTVGDMTIFGVLVIEYLHRQVWPRGWESLSYTSPAPLGSFPHRMRVTRRNPVNGPGSITPANGVGVPTISFRVRDMIVNAIWPGYVGMPRTGMSVIPAGWDSLEVGDIDEWEEGKIKPHGDDMFRPGYPRFGRGVQPTGVDATTHGDVRVARPVRVAGMPPVGFDGPSVTDEYGCSRRVITVWPIQTPTFPEPVVTT